MTEPTDADAELMKAAVKRSRDQYKLNTSRAAFQAGAIFGSAFRTPQPTQAQAGAVLLTHKNIEPVCRFLADRGIYLSDETTKALITVAHGIKGGQHGAE